MNSDAARSPKVVGLIRSPLLAAWHIAFVGSLVASNSVAATKPATIDAKEFVRCFFVYGATAQTGRDLPNRKLAEWMHGRVMWMTGYANAKQGDAAFEAAFNSVLEQSKREATKVEDDLRAALRARSQGQYESALAPTLACDRSMGLPLPATLPTL